MKTVIYHTFVNDPVLVNVVFQWWNMGVKYVGICWTMFMSRQFMNSLHGATEESVLLKQCNCTIISLHEVWVFLTFLDCCSWSLNVLDVSWLLFLKFACSWHFLALLLEVSVFLVYQKLLTRAVLTRKRSARRMQVAQSHLSQGFCLSVEACPSTVNKQHNLYQQITTTKKDNKSLMTCPCNLVLHGHDKSITWHDRCNRVLHGHDKPLTWHGPCIRLT